MANTIRIIGVESGGASTFVSPTFDPVKVHPGTGSLFKVQLELDAALGSGEQAWVVMLHPHQVTLGDLAEETQALFGSATTITLDLSWSKLSASHFSWLVPQIRNSNLKFAGSEIRVTQ